MKQTQKDTHRARYVGMALVAAVAIAAVGTAMARDDYFRSPAPVAEEPTPAAAGDAEHDAVAAQHAELEEVLQSSGIGSDPSFAGAFINPDNQAEAIVAMRGASGVRSAHAYRALAALVAKGWVRIVEHKYTQAELGAFLDAAATQLNDLLASNRPADSTDPWPFVAWADVPTNKVVFEIDKVQVPNLTAVNAVLAKLPEDAVTLVHKELLAIWPKAGDGDY
jgi:hypothetical protein